MGKVVSEGKYSSYLVFALLLIGAILYIASWAKHQDAKDERYVEISFASPKREPIQTEAISNDIKADGDERPSPVVQADLTPVRYGFVGLQTGAVERDELIFTVKVTGESLRGDALERFQKIIRDDNKKLLLTFEPILGEEGLIESIRPLVVPKQQALKEVLLLNRIRTIEEGRHLAVALCAVDLQSDHCLRTGETAEAVKDLFYFTYVLVKGGRIYTLNETMGPSQFESLKRYLQEEEHKLAEPEKIKVYKKAVYYSIKLRSKALAVDGNQLLVDIS